MDFKHPYLTQQIIAYIGNKRRLLPLIYRAIQRIYGDTLPPSLIFADPFAGSGVVSRLAKLLGFQVVSNDWEPYATTIGRAYLETNASDIEELFGSFGQFEQILLHLNTLPDPPLEEQYIARYYAPSTDDIEKADYRKERLFYTRQNALRIDRIRNEIDRLYPPASRDRLSRCRDLLIALLLYEAATHTNTSGVFKAYHRGFGGHGKDALGRILRPIRLEPPPLIDSPAPCRMYGEDATSLIRSLGFSFDLVYLDPPYNQHQYGSNYHLLNTIVLWDKAPVPLELGSDGRLKNKAGIRKDWKRTKSPYCYRETAIEAFSELLSALDAEHILISYSTDGIIPFEALRELCTEGGEVSILTNEYITYRGGKQSNHRRDRNVEFILWVQRRRSARSERERGEPGSLLARVTRLDNRKGSFTQEGASEGGDSNQKPGETRTFHALPCQEGASGSVPLDELDRVLALHRLQLLLQRVYRRDSLCKSFIIVPEGAGRFRVQIPLRHTTISVLFRYLVEPAGPVDLQFLSMEDLALLEQSLQSAVCSTRKEELDALLEVLPHTEGRDRGLYQRKILTVLRKLAHRKYRALFWEAWSRVAEVLPSSTNGESRWKEELERIRSVAELRFSDSR